MDSNLPRWMFASVSKFISDSASPYLLWIDGQEPVDPNAEKWAELYMAGPEIQPLNQAERYEIAILIGLAVKKGFTDSHLPQKLKGHFASILVSGPISVYKYGEGADDNQSYVGCLRLNNRPVTGFDFGEVATDTRLIRATVEGIFEMEL